MNEQLEEAEPEWAEHDARFTAIAKDIEAGGDPMQLLAFWIEAQGGAEQAALDAAGGAE